MKLAIVIPAYNEEKRIGETIKRIPSKIKGVAEHKVLVIDDGSKDQTSKIATDLGAVVISHGYNRGVGAAIQSALNWVIDNGFDLMVNIDADGQFKPEEISTLLDPIIKKQADLVVGNRFSNGKPANMAETKYLGNKLMNTIIGTLVGHKFDDVSSGFRAYNKEAILNLNLKGQFTYTQESFIDLAFKKLKIKQVPVSITYFKDRKSKIANNLFRYAINTSLIIIRSFRDYQPLKFFGVIGGLSFLIGCMLDLFTAIHYFSNGAFSPYIFVALSGIYLNTFGIFMIIIGLLSDMLDRMRHNQERLLYFQKKSIHEKTT